MLPERRDLVVLTAAGAVLVIGAVDARRATLRPAEARCFTVLNDLSDRAFVPVWVVMQGGSLAGSLAIGSAVAASGSVRIGVRLASVGATAWAGSKIVKWFSGRGRPASVIDTVRVRGREQAGLGYPSGHAAVAVAMATTATPSVTRHWRLPLWLAALAIASSRIYVGAHLPLDVVGGAALGVGVGRVARLGERARRAGM
jgi:membrane-associated phospholipid phosphatase